MSTTAERFRRLLAVMPRLADGSEHTIDEIAAAVGAEPAQVLGDLRELSERYADPPGWVERLNLYIEAERVSMGTTRHFRRPMRLSQDEWRAMELGLAMLCAERAPDDRPAVDATLAKVRQLMSEEPDDQLTRAASLGADRYAETIATLKDAMRERRRVALTYHKGGEDAPDQRTICPYSFAVEQGAWYLVAHCDRSSAVRIFRLDRMQDVAVLSETFDAASHPEADELFADGRAFVGSPPERLVVRYSPRVARWIAERESGARVREDGSIDVEYPLGDESWAIRHVLQYGPEAEAVAPASVRESVRSRLRAAL